MKLFVFSDPECGAKPTLYAESIECVSEMKVRECIDNAMHMIGSHSRSKIQEDEILEVVKGIIHDDYAWLDERFLIEIIDVGCYFSNRYKAALANAKGVELSGIDILEACMAKEIDAAATRFKKIIRGDREKKRLDGDLEELFLIAMGTMKESYGTFSPKEIATNVVETYLDRGMNLDSTRVMCGTLPFAMRMANKNGGV